GLPASGTRSMHPPAQGPSFQTDTTDHRRDVRAGPNETARSGTSTSTLRELERRTVSARNGYFAPSRNSRPRIRLPSERTSASYSGAGSPRVSSETTKSPLSRAKATLHLAKVRIRTANAPAGRSTVTFETSN